MQAMKKNINVKAALNNALDYARLDRREVRVKNTAHDEGTYYLAFCTDWLNYECYVDDKTGEVLGFNAYPTSEEQSREMLVTGKAFKLRNLLAAAI